VKILQVVTMFPPAVDYGGPSTVAAQQASALVRRGHQVTVATSNILELKPVQFIEDRNVELTGVEVQYFPSLVLHPHFSFIVSPKFSGWLRRHVGDFDVVHIHFARGWMPVRAAQIAIGRGILTFLQPHGMLGRQPEGLLGRIDGLRGLIDRVWIRRILDDSAGVFSLQQHEDNEIERVTSHARLLRLPNGTSLPTRVEAWAAVNLANPVVLFLARLHPRKRVLAFLEMARILRSRGVAAHYRIVGPDGGDLARAQRLVRTYGMQDEVIFVGKIQGEAIIREYLGSSVYVLPAVNEPFAMTILEALSLGVPTVVTSACYNAAMLEENGAALVSSPEPQMLANSVERVLCEPALAQSLSTAGRRLLIQEELTVDGVAKRLEKYYGDAYA
jgi:glycosyltransferase involved in cell wall biosynthesis